MIKRKENEEKKQLPLRKHQKQVVTQIQEGILLLSLMSELCCLGWAQWSVPSPVGLTLETSQDSRTMTISVIFCLHIYRMYLSGEPVCVMSLEMLITGMKSHTENP